jgi:quinone-modifying oxidoreductase subunit QmoC
MSTRVNARLLQELKAYGAVRAEECFNCGNCTAVCPLTSDSHPFPRDMIRLVQLGLKDRILASTDPWQCYYCGQCTETCPRGAEPAETMMSIRRWVTAQYDRSGHGARLYTSRAAVLFTILRYAGLTLLLLILYHVLTGGQNIVTDHVALNRFAPVELVWGLVLLHFAYLSYRLARSTLRMHQLVMRPSMEATAIPLSVYVTEFKTFVIHFFTQKRWRACGEALQKRRWLNHLLLMSGYLTMLVLVIGLLWWFQTDAIYPIYNPQRWLGYYATIVLIYASSEALIGRLRKREQMHRFSHHTDWLFPAFILVGAVTGILIHIFRYAGWAWPTYIIYTIHVMAMVAMLDTEVGVGKWSHLIYRPFAQYLERVKERAAERRPAPGPVSAGTD